MKKISYLFLALGLVLSLSCGNNIKDKKVSTIDSTLQTKTTEVLKEELNAIDGLSGHVIIMDVHTGQIKSLVSLTRKDSINFEENDDYNKLRRSGLFNTISLLSMLESGNITMNDINDTDKGILELEDGDSIYDHNWRRGGFGEISVSEGLMYSSDISTILSLKKAFSDEKDYFAALEKMSVNKPDSIEGIGSVNAATDKDTTRYNYYRDAIGYHKSSSLQTIAFYNAIANDGVMVQPQVYKDSIIVLNPSIASKENIDSLKSVLRSCVIKGTGLKTASDKISNAGNTGTLKLADDTYHMDFCGYFPSENPKYSILVSLKKKCLPASAGAMSGIVFKTLMEYLADSDKAL